ncbi:MAG: nodulation protein NfeD [Anaerolineales bacterium]|nr:nodulation protein NfeD [Anaerolineales bacterium]
MAGFRRWFRALLIVFLGMQVFLYTAEGQAERCALVLDASGPLTPAMAEYLDRGLAAAEQKACQVVVLQLDTPGGSIDLMSRMVQSIRSSAVPVVVYVSPRGAMAGSAGTVLTLAGHAAAMAPETAIGAASPVSMQGEMDEVLETKTKEIMKASIRSLAERRGYEAVALAEATVEDAAAVSSQEAYDIGLVDFIAEDLDDLFRQLDGFEVQMGTRTKTLEIAGAARETFNPSFIEQLLQTLTNPNIVFLLISVGVQALLIEISNPGGWVAGFIGVVCLALGGYGLGVLPVNWFGLIFLITAFVLFFLEVKAPTHGALAAAGIASFIAGSLILFNSPGTPAFQRVSLLLIIGMAVFTAAGFGVIISFALKAARRPASVGKEALPGKIGIVRTELNPEGMVLVAGELWSAVLEDRKTELDAGKQVQIVRVEGLHILVRPYKVEN